jgi:hypothetical protein
MASIPAAQGQEPVSPDLPGERAPGLDGGVEHAQEILQPERRFVLPAQSRRDEINSGRTQEFLASFGQIDRICMQLIVVTVRLPILTPAPHVPLHVSVSFPIFGRSARGTSHHPSRAVPILAIL